jgi:hypothetical protein
LLKKSDNKLEKIKTVKKKNESIKKETINSSSSSDSSSDEDESNNNSKSKKDNSSSYNNNDIKKKKINKKLSRKSDLNQNNEKNTKSLDLDKFINQINDENLHINLKKEPLPIIEPNESATNKYLSQDYFNYNAYSYYDIENQMVKFRKTQPSSLPKIEFDYSK